MTLSTSAVAAPCADDSFSSRVSRATFPRGPVAESPLCGEGFDAMRRFSLAAFPRRVLAGSPPALERCLISSLWARDSVR